MANRKVKLNPWCGTCDLGSWCIDRAVVSASHRELWEAWKCVRCGQKGLVNYPVHQDHVALCEWHEGRVEDLAAKAFGDGGIGDDPDEATA